MINCHVFAVKEKVMMYVAMAGGEETCTALSKQQMRVKENSAGAIMSTHYPGMSRCRAPNTSNTVYFFDTTFSYKGGPTDWQHT